MYYNKSYWLKLIPPHNLADKLAIRSESNKVAAEEFYIEILVIPYFFKKKRLLINLYTLTLFFQGVAINIIIAPLSDIQIFDIKYITM